MTAYLLSATRTYFACYAGLPKACWQGLFLNLIESTLIGIYYFLPLYFIKELQFDIAEAGFVISFYGLGTISGGLAGGKLSDKFTPGLVSLGSLLLQMLVFFGMTQFNSMATLIPCMFAMGAASYGFITSNHLWILKQCGDEAARLKAINILNIASNLGLGLSAVTIGALANYGFKYILFLGGGLLFLCAIYAAFLTVGDEPIAQDAHTPSTSPSGHKGLQSKLIFYLIFSCLFLVGLIIFQTSTTYSVYVRDAFPQWGIKSLSILFTLNCFLVVFFQSPLVTLFEKRNKLMTAGLGAFLLGLAMFILPWAAHLNVFWLAICCTVIYTAGEILFFSVAQFICYQYAPEQKKGQIVGLYRTIYAGSRVAAPVGGSLIYRQLGGDILWCLCGLIGVVCLAACHYCRKYIDGYSAEKAA